MFYDAHYLILALAGRDYAPHTHTHAELALMHRARSPADTLSTAAAHSLPFFFPLFHHPLYTCVYYTVYI